MPRPTAILRQTPADFVVEELPAYEPSGEGTHLFVRFRKTGWTSDAAIRTLAGALGVDPRGAGHAGLKDRHAITTQMASFPFPVGRDPEEALRLALPAGLEILDAKRHGNKLKPGHLDGNRFDLCLRGVAPELVDGLLADLDTLSRRGVPNRFGGQRFGRTGDNAERALAWISGRSRPPRDRRDQRFAFSALQSKLFNETLDRRVAEGTWDTVLEGDLAKKQDTGGMFLVPGGDELEDAKARAATGTLCATGPMFGARMRWPEGVPAEIERAILGGSGLTAEHLEACRHLGEGTRRPFRLPVSDLRAERAEDPDGASLLRLTFVLPKGGFATTVLSEVCDVVDATHAAPSSPDEAASEEPPDSSR
jgi:tRNA pseudouridine13 synthase